MPCRATSLALTALALAALVAMAASGASAQDASTVTDEEKEAYLKERERQMEAVNKDLAHGNVQLYAYFPQNQDQSFPVGELSTVIAGARIKENLYGKMSCYGLEARLSSPFDASQIVQNFTYYEPFHTVMQGKDKTLHLKIMPAKELQARQFRLTVLVQCSYLLAPPESPADFDKGISYINVAFNETCDFVDIATAYDLDFFVLVAIFTSVVGGMLYIFTDLFSASSKSKGGKDATAKKAKAKKVETGTVEANGEEWLQGTYAVKTKKSAQSKKKK